MGPVGRELKGSATAFPMDQRLKHHLLTILRLSLGWFFIALGIVGLFLPVLQGIIFIALGVALLAPHVPFFARLRDMIYRRFPPSRHFVAKAKVWGHRWKDRILHRGRTER